MATTIRCSRSCSQRRPTTRAFTSLASRSARPIGVAWRSDHSPLMDSKTSPAAAASTGSIPTAPSVSCKYGPIDNPALTGCFGQFDSRFVSSSSSGTMFRTHYRKGINMTVQTLTLGKQKFVVVPEKEFRRLQKKAEEISAQDRGDIAEAKRREKEPSISLEAVRKRIGL
jgi:hypothetical protein